MKRKRGASQRRSSFKQRTNRPKHQKNRHHDRQTDKPVVSQKPASHVRGRITLKSRGFGFVVSEDGGADVFVPAQYVGEAMHGDRVEVEVRQSQKGLDGRVVRVLERWLTHLTGTVRSSGKASWIEPDDIRLSHQVHLSGPVPEGAEGHVVKCEILKYPRGPTSPLDVRIVEVLGKAGDPIVEVQKILTREGVQEAFRAEVIQEAEQFPETVHPESLTGREDLRNYPLLTIDPVDARDHDDALWAERNANGTYRLIVAIADVSHYLPEGSAMDKEALARGCSIYLPDRAIPMLPRQLSSKLASLTPGDDRLCLALDITLNKKGDVKSHRVIEGVMRSHARLTYEGVAAALGLTEDNARSKDEALQYLPILRVLYELSQKRRKTRLRAGYLEFDVPEAKVTVEKETLQPITVQKSRRDPGVRSCYELVEEMMLLANEIIASALADAGANVVYRVHGRPDDRKIQAFFEVGESLGYQFEVDGEAESKDLARFLDRVELPAHHQILSYLLLRAMQQAVYSTTNIGHFALSASHYAHFTSPIRRYPDVVVHRAVYKYLLNHREMKYPKLGPLNIGALESTRLERRAMSVERSTVDFYRALLMKPHVGEVFDATLVRIEDYGFYSSMEDPFIEFFTPFEILPEWFELDPTGVHMIGETTGMRYALGDVVRLRIEHVDIVRGQVIANLATTEPSNAEARGKRPKKPKHERENTSKRKPKPKDRPKRKRR